MRRSDLADQVHVPDVDPELQRGRRDDCAKATGFEAGFSIEPCFFREASVMRRNGARADAIGQMTRHSLCHSACVHKHEGRPVREDQRRKPVVILLPDLVGHDRLEG